MESHPIAALFPEMSDDEFVALKEDIRQYGVKAPVLVHGGQILDGRHRYRRGPIADSDPGPPALTSAQYAKDFNESKLMGRQTSAARTADQTYNFWRPITAIRETADDGNPATTPDPTWTPLFATPAHPDYTSGHSCVSGAATAILAHEFGDHTRFDVTSDLMIGVTRSFHSFTDALEEVKNARVFAGIHFRTACDDGANLGKAVAEYVLEHKFQRVH
jgi:hypothetical protein